MRVLQVRNPASVYSEYEGYVGRVGNEQRRFHGTSLAPGCAFGIDVYATARPRASTPQPALAPPRLRLLIVPRGVP